MSSSSRLTRVSAANASNKKAPTASQVPKPTSTNPLATNKRKEAAARRATQKEQAQPRRGFNQPQSGSTAGPSIDPRLLDVAAAAPSLSTPAQLPSTVAILSGATGTMHGVGTVPTVPHVAPPAAPIAQPVAHHAPVAPTAPGPHISILPAPAQPTPAPQAGPTPMNVDAATNGPTREGELAAQVELLRAQLEAAQTAQQQPALGGNQGAAAPPAHVATVPRTHVIAAPPIQATIAPAAHLAGVPPAHVAAVPPIQITAAMPAQGTAVPPPIQGGVTMHAQSVAPAPAQGAAPAPAQAAAAAPVQGAAEVPVQCPGNGSAGDGFNLQDVMGLDSNPKLYKAIRSGVHRIVAASMINCRIPWPHQDTAKLVRIYQVARSRFPYLRHFPNDWVTREMVRSSLKNQHAYLRRVGGDEIVQVFVNATVANMYAADSE